MAPPTKRRKTAVVEEVVFDSSARQEYLSGFHKRKLQRAKYSQELAAKKAREDRIHERRVVSATLTALVQCQHLANRVA